MLAALAIVLLSCQTQSPEQQLLKSAEPVASWLATLRMTSEKWAANSAPSRFVRSTAQAADDSFEQAERDAERSKANPAVREPFHRLFADSRSACDQLRRAAVVDDRAAALPIARQLAALQAELADLRQSQGEPSP
jgi:hypothetical protein